MTEDKYPIKRKIELESLHPDDFYKMEPWTWISFESPYYENLTQTSYMFLFYGVKEYITPEEEKKKFLEVSEGKASLKDVYHYPTFPIVLDFATNDHYQEHIYIGNDCYEAYSPSSIETWKDTLERGKEGDNLLDLDYWMSFRLSNERKIQIAETVLKRRGIFIQKSLGTVYYNGSEESQIHGYPYGLINIY